MILRPPSLAAPTSRQLAAGWAFVAVLSALCGLAAMATDRDLPFVLVLDGVGLAALLMALGNWHGWIRLQ